MGTGFCKHGDEYLS